MLGVLESNAAAFDEAARVAEFWTDALLCRQAAEKTRALLAELNVEG